MLNSLLKPYAELTAAAADITAMAELADEDAAFEAELEPALVAAEQRYEAFELQAMMSGKHDAHSAMTQHFQQAISFSQTTEFVSRLRR